MFTVMFILCLSVLPSFASAEEQKGENVLNYLGDLNDNNKETKIIIPGNTEKVFKFNNVYKGASEFYISYKHTFRLPLNPLRFEFYFEGVKKNQYELRSLMGKNDSVLEGTFKIGYSDVFDELRLVSSGSQYETYIYELKVFTMPRFEAPEIINLNAITGVNDVNFSWENPKKNEFTGVKIYKEDILVTTVDKNETSYKVDGLEANKNYNFKFVAMYGDIASSGIQKGIKTLVDPKTIPPGPVSSLTAEPTDKTVKLKWKKPKDDDLAGFKILQNGKQVAEIGLEEEFTVKNLQPLTDYTFGVMAVDRDKNDSSPVNLSVKTLEENDNEPPLVPSNVFAKPSNGALIASWDKVSDKDLAGYNVYVDDKKINSNLVSSTNFTIKNLENNRKYKIQVQAVDRSGNASALSLAAYGIPDEKTLPIIESNYSLQDVSDGVGVMFGQFWTVLAFAVGLPLAFYIIFKLKHVILP
ncbi:fibronectin type III domain-containing protein [Bacillus tropicus]|nr:fibronectin type III domain-containing protein [Bacillus tropicus]MED2903860.1 fibronectin type III domain-containing protein [Bacillus tropicus]